MSKKINLAALLTVVGGIGAAVLPATGHATCNATGGFASAGSSSRDGGDGQIDARAEYADGLNAVKAQDFRRAKIAFGRVLSVAPREPNALYLAGLARMGLGDYGGAATMLEKAVRYAPNLYYAQRDLAGAYIKLGKMDRAQQVLASLEAKSAACQNSCDDAGTLGSAIASVKDAMAAVNG